MPISQDLPTESSHSSSSSLKTSPKRILIILAVLIYAAEIVAMLVLYFIPLPYYFLEAVLDGFIMLVMVLPSLYFLQLKPLSRQIQEREKAADALRQNEKLLRNLLEMMPVGVWVVDANGKIVQGNTASQEIWGGARYVGVDQYGEYKGWWLNTGKSIESEEWAATRAIKYQETSINEEIEIENFDGERKVILNSASPIYSENQSLAGAVVVNQDITALKRAQQEALEHEVLFRTAMENLPVGVWLTDGGGKITYANPAGQAIWAGARYVGKEGFGEYKGWWLATGKQIEVDEWAVARAIDKGETSLNEEIEIECFDGTHKIILNSAIPVRDAQGRTLWAFVVNQDITARKQHERELVQTNELLERFFASINTLIAYMDRDFNFIRVNDAYASSAGHPPEFFIGKNHFDLYPHEENEAIFRQVVETGEPYLVLQKPFEYPEYPERGITYWDWSVQPVRGAKGEVQGLVLSLVDVTEQKRAEIQLAQQHQELLELSRAEHRQRELAESLVQSTIAVTSSLQLDVVFDAILEQIHRNIPFGLANIALIENGSIRVVGYLAFDVPPMAKDAMKNTYDLESNPFWSRAYATRQPIIISDREASPEWQVVPGMEWVRSYAAVPLIAGGEVIGFININSDQPGYFEEQMADRLQAFAVPAALAIQNARLFLAEKTARRAAETLSDAALAMAQTLDQDQVLRSLLDHIEDTIAPDISGVGLLDDEEHLVVRAAQGYPPWTGPEFTFSIPAEVGTDTIYNKCIKTRKSQVVEDTATEPLLISQPGLEHVRNWLLVPIIAHGKTIGIVGQGKTEPRYFTQDHVHLVEALASQVAVAIQNAWLFEQVRSSSERLQSLARKLVELQENERYYIARELHDEAGQALAVLKLNLGRLEQDPECPQQIRKKLENLKEMVDHVLEELHRLAVDLHPVVLDHLGLVAALEQYAKNLTSDHLSVQFKALGFEADRLPKDLESCLYRIVQEALANVLRHAQAKNVGILLERAHGKVRLFVEDDGIGFDPDSPEYKNRLGLVGMLERAEMFGGTLTIESSPGKGTSIIIEVQDANSYSHRR